VKKILVAKIATYLALAAVLIGTINFGVLPNLRSFDESLLLVEQSEAQLGLELIRLQQLKALDAAKPDLLDQQSLLRLAVSERAETTDYSSNLDRLAKASGVFLDSLQFADSRAYALPEGLVGDPVVAAANSLVGENLNSISVEFSGSGGLANLIRFLGRVQADPRFILVDSFSLINSDASGVYRVRVSGSLFFATQPAG
jgi:hypothetical protein